MNRSCWTAYLAALAFAAPCRAADTAPIAWNTGDILMIQASPVTVHYESSADRHGHPWLVGAEWQRPSNWLGGYSYFNNSFDQKCHYLYGGYIWQFSEPNPAWYFKLTGGVILGYKEPYENKIPLNNNGVALAVIPGVGYKMGRFNVQLNLLGNAGIMATFGYDLMR